MARHKVPPKDAPTYRATMRAINAFSEHAAPETFKWVGWAVALAAIEVVRRRTAADWLLILEVVLALLVLLRIIWRLTPAAAPEATEPDGGISFDLTASRIAWSGFVGLVCWAIMLTLTLGLANLIAESELLVDKTPNAVPASPPHRAKPLKRPIHPGKEPGGFLPSATIDSARSNRTAIALAPTAKVLGEVASCVLKDTVAN